MSASAWAFGLGVIWLIWNIVVSIIGAAVQDDTIANSPFAASPLAWLASLGLVLVGVITSVYKK